MNEVAEIIDKLLINNDKFIIKIIMEYTYPKCCKCYKLFNEETERLRFDENHICEKCFILIDWKCCNRCRNYYNRMTNVYCRSCLGKCRIYCPVCLEDSNRIPTLSSDLLDDIIQSITN